MVQIITDFVSLYTKASVNRVNNVIRLAEKTNLPKLCTQKE